MPDKYVAMAPLGNDGNSGNNAGEPYGTINRALDTVGGAFTIYVADGTYYPTSKLEYHNSGVTLRATNLPSGTAFGRFFGFGALTPSAIIDGSNLPAGTNMVEIYNDHNTTLQGFEMRNGPLRGMTITGDNVTIKDCYVHHMQRHTGFAYACNDLVLENIEMGPNGFSGTWHNFYPSGCQRTVVQFCYIHDGTQAGVHINAEESNISRGNIVDSNIFGSGGNNRSNFMSTHDSFLTNNLFVNHFWDCNNNPGYGEAGSDNHVIANNTFIQTVRSYAIRLFGANTGSDPRYCCADDNTVFNNVLITTNGANAIIDDGTNNVLGYNYTATYSPALIAELFANTTAYRIWSNSALRNAGINVFNGKAAPTTDFEGDPRTGVTPDIGWDEYYVKGRVSYFSMQLYDDPIGNAPGSVKKTVKGSVS
jgi:hypothetical protein